jgi:hypothetical protein
MLFQSSPRTSNDLGFLHLRHEHLAACSTIFEPSPTYPDRLYPLQLWTRISHCLEYDTQNDFRLTWLTLYSSTYKSDSLITLISMRKSSSAYFDRPFLRLSPRENIRLPEPPYPNRLSPILIVRTLFQPRSSEKEYSNTSLSESSST